MAKPTKQLRIGSLQPLLFCVGMYLVVLISSVFICSSIYRTLNPGKQPMTLKSSTPNPAPDRVNSTMARL